MSLNRSERELTRVELQHNRELSGWSIEQLADALGIDDSRVRAAWGVTGADPADVWLVADALDAAARVAGLEPAPYTFLNDGYRAAATGWFGLRPKAEVREAVLRASAARMA